MGNLLLANLLTRKIKVIQTEMIGLDTNTNPQENIKSTSKNNYRSKYKKSFKCIFVF